MLIISFLNILLRFVKVDSKHIVILMTFPEDILPVIKQLVKEEYQITVIGDYKYEVQLNKMDKVNFIKAGNKNVIKHIKALSKAKVIIIDTYYLMLGGYHKKKGQTIIQTWHAAGALKNFGLTDHKVDLSNHQMVQQYKEVYHATDYYLIGGEEMGHCFQDSFDAKPEQMLRFGLPRLTEYFISNLEQKKLELKKQYGIDKKLAVYVPTYREEKGKNRQIDKEHFESMLPNYTIINQLHPSVKHMSSGISTQELMIMADVIISDYSSLPIEVSLLKTPTIFYAYDEQDYDRLRGLNQFYWTIPDIYKVYDEASLIHKIKQDGDKLEPLFNSWHDYNSEYSIEHLINYINKLVKE